MEGGRGKPLQSDLRRAVSTSYYALFHELCRNAADCLIGTSGADRSRPAWRQVYRAVEHGHVEERCKDGTIRRFPKYIEDFAERFLDLQEKRHRADYDPEARFSRSEVQLVIQQVDATLRAFRTVGLKDRRAFAAWVTIKDRKRG